MGKKVILTLEEKEKIRKLYNNGFSHRKVAEKTGISEKVVITRLRKWGIVRSRSEAARKYNVIEDVFSFKNTNSLYWAGFLITDGNVWHSHGRQSRINLAIQQRDRKHLEKLAEFVGMPSCSIHDSKKRNISRLTIASDQMATDLVSFGIVPRKTFTVKIPNNDPTILYSRDFWRAAIDGDGSVLIARPNYSVLSLYSSSSVFLSQFEMFLDYYNLPRGNLSKRSYVLSGKKSIPVIDKLYSNAEIFLDRKYNTANEILKW